MVCADEARLASAVQPVDAVRSHGHSLTGSCLAMLRGERLQRGSSWPPGEGVPAGVGTVLALVFVIPAVMLRDPARRHAWRR